MQVSFLNDGECSKMEDSLSRVSRQKFETTQMKRSTYLSQLLSVLTEGVLPLISIITSLVNSLELFLQGEIGLGCVSIFIFILPTFLVVFFYLENMFHRENKLKEIGLIVGLGPFMRWICLVRLLAHKLRESRMEDLDDLETFVFATNMIDGIFQASVQILWLMYLIAVDIFPLPFVTFKTREVTDLFGNTLELPVVSGYTLYTSVLILVKNLYQLWKMFYPVADRESSVLQPENHSFLKSIYLSTLLVLFTASTVVYRLLSYFTLILHLNFFLIPSLGIMMGSLVLHIVLRGMSDRFYVETSKMDVFLSAVCSSILPTPTSSCIRAHNLLQAHTLITNLLLFIALGVALFFNLDYWVPIVKRPDNLIISSSAFFTNCMLAICLFPVSYIFYYLYQREIPHFKSLNTSIFWKNKRPTIPLFFTIFLFLFVFTVLFLLLILGLYSSSHCDPSQHPLRHGILTPTSDGLLVECHVNYEPTPARGLYCMWFFGPQGIIHLLPLYFKQMHGSSNLGSHSSNDLGRGKQPSPQTFLRGLAGIECVHKNRSLPLCSVALTGSCDIKASLLD